MASSGVFSGSGQHTLQAAFERKDYYEAHQILKSLNFRLIRQKKYDELSNLLFDGCIEFFKLGENQSGVDLAKHFIELLEKGDFPVNAQTVERVIAIMRAMPRDMKNERGSFLHSVITWSQKRNPETKAGHVILHKSIANLCLEEDSPEQALYHSVRALDADACLKSLGSLAVEVEQGSAANGNEPSIENETTDHLLAAISVLEFLTLQRFDLAKDLFTRYVSNHPNPEVRTKCYNVRVLALMAALLALCAKPEQENVAEEFQHVQSALGDVWPDNQRVEKMLSKIGFLYFGVQAKSPFGNLFGGLLSGNKATSSSTRESVPAASGPSPVVQSDMDLD